MNTRKFKMTIIATAISSTFIAGTAQAASSMDGGDVFPGGVNGFADTSNAIVQLDQEIADVDNLARSAAREVIKLYEENEAIDIEMERIAKESAAAKLAADNAKTAAGNAATAAGNAEKAAGDALTAAGDAVTAAGNAEKTAGDAAKAASDALTAAGDALTTADQNAKDIVGTQRAASAASIGANEAKMAAEKNARDLDTTNRIVNSQGTTLALMEAAVGEEIIAEEIQDKAIEDVTADVTAHVTQYNKDMADQAQHNQNLYDNDADLATAINIGDQRLRTDLAKTDAEVDQMALDQAKIERDVSWNAESIGLNIEEIERNTGSIQAIGQKADKNTLDIYQNYQDIGTNMGNIRDNARGVAANSQNIERNAEDIVHVNSLVSRNTGHISENRETLVEHSARIESNTNLGEQAIRGVAISAAMNVILPDPGKKFRLNMAAATFGGTKAIGITGAGRINNNVAAHFGFGFDTNGEDKLGSAGVSYQW